MIIYRLFSLNLPQEDSIEWYKKLSQELKRKFKTSPIQIFVGDISYEYPATKGMESVVLEFDDQTLAVMSFDGHGNWFEPSLSRYSKPTRIKEPKLFLAEALKSETELLEDAETKNVMYWLLSVLDGRTKIFSLCPW